MAAPKCNRRSTQLNIFVLHSQSLVSWYWSCIDSIMMFKKSHRVIFHTIIHEKMYNKANLQIEQAWVFRASLGYIWGYWECYLSFLVSKRCFLVVFSQDIEQLSPSGIRILIESYSNFLGMRSNAAVTSTNKRYKGCFLRPDIWLCLIPWSD